MPRRVDGALATRVASRVQAEIVAQEVPPRRVGIAEAEWAAAEGEKAAMEAAMEARVHDGHHMEQTRRAVCSQSSSPPPRSPNRWSADGVPTVPSSLAALPHTQCRIQRTSRCLRRRRRPACTRPILRAMLRGGPFAGWCITRIQLSSPPGHTSASRSLGRCGCSSHGSRRLRRANGSARGPIDRP